MPNNRVENMKINKQTGFLSLPNDNIVKTLAVATLLCLICSVIVSATATLLKPQQTQNKLIDKQRNIVSVAGLSDADTELTPAVVQNLFTKVEPKVVDLRTGEYTDAVDPSDYDQQKASKDSSMNIKLSKEQDIASVVTTAKYGLVYLVKEGNQVKKVIVPVKGYGLWSTMFGFVALEGDAKTVSGITFYDHGETPGLGGEIENPKWQKSWQGKMIYDESGEPKLSVIKGTVNQELADAKYQIDGLAGATLTSTGVTNLIHFWMGKDGYGPYLKRLQSKPETAKVSTETEEARG